jgi:hypothetical protein
MHLAEKSSSRMKRLGASLAVLLAMSLVTAPAAQSDQSIAFNVNLSDCTFTTSLGSALTISLRQGEQLTIQINSTGTRSGPPWCEFALETGDETTLIGWTVDGRDLTGFSATVYELQNAATFEVRFTVGSVNAFAFVETQGVGKIPPNRILVNVVSGAVTELPLVQHTLGFDANGGQCTLTSSGPIFDGTWITVPTIQQCTRPGYRLLGWNPKSDGSDPLGFDPGGWTVMTGDNTLYAIWVPSASS